MSKKIVTIISETEKFDQTAFVTSILKTVLKIFSGYPVDYRYGNVKVMSLITPLYIHLHAFLIKTNPAYTEFGTVELFDNRYAYAFPYEKDLIENYLQATNQTKDSKIYTTTEFAEPITYKQYLRQLETWYKSIFGKDIYTKILINELDNYLDDDSGLYEDYVIIENAEHLSEVNAIKTLCDRKKI